MHILLIKVQQKIMDDKVDELIAHLTDGLEMTHLQIATRNTNNLSIRELISAFSILLDILALQKDFAGCFKQLPLEAISLLQDEPIGIEQQHEVYELLKDKLLNINNHVHETNHRKDVFAKYLSVNRPFFEAYITLWNQLMINKLTPSVSVLERMAYGVLNLLNLLVEHNLIHQALYPLTEQDEELITRYNQNRVLRIDEALMEGSVDGELVMNDPNNQRIPCLKCGSYGALKGYTENGLDGQYFIAYGYQCNQCGMELFDQKDLLLAGIKPIYAVL
jgi:hypothetical protein